MHVIWGTIIPARILTYIDGLRNFVATVHVQVVNPPTIKLVTINCFCLQPPQ